MHDQPGYTNLPFPMKPCSDLTFAMRVVGNSMTASSGLSFPEDTVIYVDPQKPHENGSFVVAKINGSVTFKRLVIDGGASLLIPLNPQYPSITVTNEVEIIGSVIGAYTDL